MRVLVRWANLKRYPIAYPILASEHPPPWNGPNFHGSARHQINAVPISGDPKAFFRFLTYMRKLAHLIFEKAISWWT